MECIPAGQNHQTGFREGQTAAEGSVIMLTITDFFPKDGDYKKCICVKKLFQFRVFKIYKFYTTKKWAFVRIGGNTVQKMRRRKTFDKHFRKLP